MPSILIVDHNVQLIPFIVGMLELLANVSHATDRTAALRAMKTRAPDLVLLGEQTPGMSRLKLGQIRLCAPAPAAIPITLVTGHTSAEAQMRALVTAAIEFIVKPSGSVGQVSSRSSIC
ncbi:response regulator [Roseateles chitinivorans]|uniref:response regulator n=1 Tax=Roseateles chitinivorans TaxID=2917965 RepID=UPI003D67C7E3